MGICCSTIGGACIRLGNELPCHGVDKQVVDVDAIKTKTRHKWTPSEVKQIWKKTQSIKHPESAECLYCGELIGVAEKRLTRWQIDHFVAFAKGGQDSIHSCFPACIQCNSDKGDLSIAEFLSSIKHEQHLKSKSKNKNKMRSRRCLYLLPTGSLCIQRYQDINQVFCSQHQPHK